MDEINTTLLIAALEAEGTIEPCDDINAHPLDWMDATGVDLIDDYFKDNDPLYALLLEEAN